MHMRSSPVFLRTNKMGCPYGLTEGRTQPFANIASTYFRTSACSECDKRNCLKRGGAASGSRSWMRWSSSRAGGMPGSAKTSANSSEHIASMRCYTYDCSDCNDCIDAMLATPCTCRCLAQNAAKCGSCTTGNSARSLSNTIHASHESYFTVFKRLFKEHSSTTLFGADEAPSMSTPPGKRTYCLGQSISGD